MLTHAMANNVMPFNTLDKHRLGNSEKYAAELSVWMKESENSFQDC